MPDIPNRYPKALEALSVAPFRWLFASNFAFFFIIQGQFITRMFLAWDLTHQERSLAVLSVFVAVPMLISSLFGGALADRLDRKKLMLFGQGLLLGTESFVFIELVRGNIQFWHLLVGSVVNGFAYPIIMPSRMAVVYQLVGNNLFTNAMALSNSVVNVTRVAGPGIIGWILDVGGATQAYAVGIAMHVIGWLCVFMLPACQSAQQDNPRPFLEDTLAGYKYVLGSRPIRILIGFGFIAMMLQAPVQNLFVVFTDEVWKIGEGGFGMLVAATGIGGVFGSLWVAIRGDKSSKVRSMIIGTLICCLLMVGFSQSNSFCLGVMFLVVATVFANISSTNNNTLALSLADDKMRGRVSGVLGMSFGLTPLGVIPLAFLSEQFGIQMAVTIVALVLGGLAGIVYLSSKTLRTMDQRARELTRERRSKAAN